MISDQVGVRFSSGVEIDVDDFTLFAIARRFAQDRSDLDARWKALQTEVHPDRFASAGAAAQRVAMQWTIRINEAYQRLKNSLDRAAYLCELHGQPVEAEVNKAIPAAFLMQQMAWREELEAAQSSSGVEALDAVVSARQRALQDELAALIDERQDWPAAAGTIRELMFVERFASDIRRSLDALNDRQFFGIVAGH